MAGSILESDLFKTREKERERMMKMYTNEEAKSCSQHQRDDISEGNSSINDRMMDTNSGTGARSLKKGAKKGTSTAK